MGKYIVLVVALLLAVWIFPYNKLVGGIFGVLGVGVFCLIWHCDNRTYDIKRSSSPL